MDTINDLFNQAELSEASYANFVDDSGNLITDPDDSWGEGDVVD
jgi:hypothetical protein